MTSNIMERPAREIDWVSSSSEFLLNPRTPPSERGQMIALLEQATPMLGHVFLCTSGTTKAASKTRQLRWVALSKGAILASAKAVNDHIQSDHRDCWINVLPDFHIGGLSIWARAFLSGASVIEEMAALGAWSVDGFIPLVENQGGTLTSLVPTQLYDLVRARSRAPKSLRAVFVGGSALSEELYLKARELDWPILPTYGMSELASQVATSLLTQEDPRRDSSMKVLSHVEIRIESDGEIALRGPSLFSGYFQVENEKACFNPTKRGEWFLTGDLGELKGETLTVFGRKDDIVKISGEKVNLGRIERFFIEEKERLGLDGDVAVVPVGHDRLGTEIHLYSTVSLGALGRLVGALNDRVMPFERVAKYHHVNHIPKSALNKVQRGEL